MYSQYQKTMFHLSLFFFNDTATTEIYTLSLHDALPICAVMEVSHQGLSWQSMGPHCSCRHRSEEHTSELQSLAYLVCRLLLEQKTRPPARPPAERILTPSRSLPLCLRLS